MLVIFAIGCYVMTIGMRYWILNAPFFFFLSPVLFRHHLLPLHARAKLDMYAIWDIQATAAQNTAIDNSLLIISERELTFTFAICYRPSVCRLSVVCNVRAPYSGGSNFREYFYCIRYLGHSLTFAENFTEIAQGNPSAGRVKHKRGSKIQRFWSYRRLYLGNGAIQEVLS